MEQYCRVLVVNFKKSKKDETAVLSIFGLVLVNVLGNFQN